MKLSDLGGACLVCVEAVRRRTCECPCGESGHLGVCRVWIWPPMTYRLGLIGNGRHARYMPICEQCLLALHADGHLQAVETCSGFSSLYRDTEAIEVWHTQHYPGTE